MWARRLGAMLSLIAGGAGAEPYGIANEHWIEGEPGAPGSVFRECAACPEMVVAPAGAFLMGSPADEAGRDHDEDQAPVAFSAPFAVARHELDFAAWRACVAAGACAIDPRYVEEPGRLPAIGVSWDDARGYLAWLSAELPGARYRLPSEAEWEYAARAGAASAYGTGSAISTFKVNFDGGEAGGIRGATVEIGSLNHPNAWGLHEMAGNVAEWTADCYAATLAPRPAEGAARDRPYCAERVIRGGSWADRAKDLRAAARAVAHPETRSTRIGFRPVRELAGAR